MRLVVEESKCVGCRVCELACSFYLKKMYNPEASCIRIYFKDDGSLDINVSMDCLCLNTVYPPCVEFCPTHAITVLM